MAITKFTELNYHAAATSFDQDLQFATLEGRAGFVSYYNSALTTAGRVTRITVGSNPLKMRYYIKVGAQTTFAIIEAPTITGAGTAITVYGYNRRLPLLCSAAFYSGTTYTGGTTLKTNVAGSGTNAGQAQTGDTSDNVMYVLAPNTEYIFVATPSTTTMYYGEVLFWETNA